MLQKAHKVIFIGDSLTDGAAWPEWVIHTLHANGYPDLFFANAGICGDTIALVKARYAKDVLALKPDWVVLCIGVNDVIRKDPRERCLADTDEVLGSLRAAGAQVLLLTPPSLEKPESNAELIARNPLLKALAVRHGCVVGDLHEVFEQSTRAGKRLWGGDGIHHEIEGWRAMGRCVLDALGCRAPLIETVEPYSGAVTDWRVGPPVSWKEGDPIPVPDGGMPAGWTRFDKAALSATVRWHDLCMLDRGGVMPLGSPAMPAGSGAFAVATVESPEDRDAVLWVGGSSPLVVWLDGKQVWCGLRPHGFHPNADRVAIRIRKGANRLVVFSTWLFHISIAP